MRISLVLLRRNHFRIGQLRLDGTQHAVRTVYSLKTGRTLELRYVLKPAGVATMIATWKRGPKQSLEEHIITHSGSADEMAVRALDVIYVLTRQ